MENTNSNQGNAVEVSETATVTIKAFTFEQHTDAIFTALKGANQRLKDDMKPKVKKLFKTWDILAHRRATSNSVSIDGEVYEISEYKIIDLFLEYVPPVFITATGRISSPDLTLRPEGLDVKNLMTPEDANNVLVAISKYLRIPSSPFVRQKGISLSEITEEKLGIGDYFNGEEHSFKSIRYVLNPEIIIPTLFWNEDLSEGRLVKRMGAHFVNRFISEMLPEDNKPKQTSAE